MTDNEALTRFQAALAAVVEDVKKRGNRSDPFPVTQDTLDAINDVRAECGLPPL